MVAGTVAAAVWVFWAVLFLVTLVNLAVFRRPRRADAEAAALRLGEPVRPADGLPAVSIVIPARDEERDLGATLEAALAQDWPRLQVIVVDDRSADATGAIARRFAAADARLTVVAGEEPPPGWLGKPHALAQGSAEADGEWLLFMDADVELAPTAVSTAVAHAEERGLDHLALFPRFERRGFWEEVLMPSLAMALFVYFPSFLSVLRRPRVLVGSLAFGSGSFNLVRSAAHRAIGGHAALRDSVIDDLRLAVELKRAGFRSRIALGDRLVKLRMYRGRREILRGFEKNLHAVLARHPVFSFLNLTFGTFCNLAPPVWFVLVAWFRGRGVEPGGAFAWVTSAAGGLLAPAFLLLLLSRLLVHRRLGYPLWSIALHPVSVLAGTWIALRSLRTAYGEGVVRWRGREYRRDQTRF